MGICRWNKLDKNRVTKDTNTKTNDPPPTTTTRRRGRSGTDPNGVCRATPVLVLDGGMLVLSVPKVTAASAVRWVHPLHPKQPKHAKCLGATALALNPRKTGRDWRLRRELGMETRAPG